MRYTVDLKTVGGLLERGRQALGLTQDRLATVIESSHRTVQRMQAGQAFLSEEQMKLLARAVFAVDRSLAAEMASAIGQTLESLGLVPPPPPPPPPAEPPGPPPPPADVVPLLADAVVAAAAEVLDLSPGAMRPAVVAALECLQRSRVGVDEVLAALKAGRARAAARGKRAPSVAPAPGR